MPEPMAADRNLNPHKPARLAMVIWGRRYSQQSAGSMDFWDALSDSEKRLASELVDEIAEAHDMSDTR